MIEPKVNGDTLVWATVLDDRTRSTHAEPTLPQFKCDHCDAIAMTFCRYDPVITGSFNCRGDYVLGPTPPCQRFQNVART